MNREKLTEAVAAAAVTYGMNFYTGHEYQMNEMVKGTPALWLTSIETARIEGIGEGITTYAIKLIIIDIPDRQSLAEPIWQQMENKAFGICAAIANTECVKSISDVELAAANNSITNRGEISMSITMTVHIPFLKIND